MGKIGIVDYGAGNLLSVSKALDYLLVEHQLVQQAEQLADVSALILPGVGAFPKAMEALRHSGLLESVREQAGQKPFLGICLGMQMLFDRSEEMGGADGLGLLPGTVRKIPTALKLPQIGWNQLEFWRNDRLTRDLPETAYVYFVHSYMVCPQQASDVVACCDYGTKVPAMVSWGQLFGCQFHPEKSGDIGIQILKNFAALS